MDTGKMLLVNQVISNVEKEGNRLKFTYFLNSEWIEDCKNNEYKSIQIHHIFKGKIFDVITYDIENIPLSDTVYISDKNRDKYSIKKGYDIVTHLKRFMR